MQRARRLASVAVVATLAVSGLAACRSQPDVAVYFGDTSAITVAEVQRIYNDVKSRLETAQQLALQRQAEAGQALGLPADSEYLKLYVENRLLLNQLLSITKPVKASDADVQHVYDVFKETGAMDPSLTFDMFKQQVNPQALQTLGSAVAVRNDLQAQLDQLNVKVNPRYEPAEIDVYSESGPDNQPLSLVSVPLADADDASPVTDAA